MVTVLLSTILVLSCLPSALLDFAIPKWKADPDVRIEDAYKWIYQATRGGEHAAPDGEMARQWLDEEWKSLGPPEHHERLWEPLCHDASISRLNLRVFKAKGGKMDDIFGAFLASSAEYQETGTRFVDTWMLLGKRLKKHRSGVLTYAEWARLDREIKVKNYPAIHHSHQFKNAHHPAYRLINASERRKLKAVLSPSFMLP
jgi:hypothetical protein